MDDLLDLNFSSSASKPTGQAPPPSTNPARSFDLFAQPGASTPTYYSTTPLRASTPVISAPPSARPNGNGSAGSALASPAVGAGPSRSATPVTAPSSAAASDAFSGLFAMSGTPGGSKNMTMAEKQAQLTREKKEKDEADRLRYAGDGAFWEKLGGSSSNGVVPPRPASTTPSNHFDDLLKPTSRPASASGFKPPPSPSAPTLKPAFAAPSPLSGGKPKAAGTFWDQHSDLLSPSPSLSNSSHVAVTSSPAPPPISSGVSSPSVPADPWDFDALSSTVGSAQPSKPTSGMRTPVSDFDFGERDEVDDGDNLLGELGRPAKPRSTAPAPRPAAKTTRSSSPPPHILGQIVEMGFSPAQARQALAKTDTGVNVEAALEFLLQGQSARVGHDDFDDEADDDRVERERERREEERARRHRERRAGPSRDSIHPEPRDRPRDRQTGDDSPADGDKLYTQASEIQQAVWSRATSLWNSGKERAMKMYEEQKRALEQQQQNAARRAGGQGKYDAGADGRPRWMVDAEENGWRDEAGAQADAGGFRDDDDEEGGEAQARPEPRRAQAAPSRAQPAARPTQADRSQMSVKERADLLFADQPEQYISPHRRPKKSPTPAIPSTPASRPRSPAAPLRTRTLIPASAGQVQTSSTHKAKGNEHFKLGRFAEAEAAYTTAVSALPEGHILLVPLYNNRAATRLKLGESGGAVADCSEVLKLVGDGYHPSKEVALPAEWSEVKLPEGMGKAYVKRAQAWEMGEKWKAAMEDWERVLGLDVVFLGSTAAATRSMAAEGVRRSKRMLEGGEAVAPGPNAAGSVSAKPKPKPKPTAPSRPADIDKSAAVGELRKAAQAAEAEEEARIAVKDSVDARLVAWRSGKETNLRALIASLDTVLWDEMLKGGLKVGMHELVTEKQVKIKYMKVIARLHPDKLNVGNTTVEQRMLANGAFGTLSEAWQTFNSA